MKEEPWTWHEGKTTHKSSKLKSEASPLSKYNNYRNLSVEVGS